ncbi:MAG TPA: amidohydrolase family protein [Verrucomicrobiae bacterium]|nr:amidohydrolase family protein [Verrucomicrobiae bacterium]
MNIDVHAHYIPPGSLKAASDVGRSHGLKLEKDERDRDVLTRDDRPLLTQPKGEFSDLDLRLSIMDHQGVDMQALAPAGSYFFYWMAAANGLEYARWLNDRFAEAVAKHPRRFVGLASVPMQDGALAAVELERAIAKLGFARRGDRLEHQRPLFGRPRLRTFLGGGASVGCADLRPS